MKFRDEIDSVLNFGHYASLYLYDLCDLFRLESDKFLWNCSTD